MSSIPLGRGLVLCLGLSLAATGAAQAPEGMAARPAAPVYPVQRLVRYSFTLHNQSAAALEHGSLSVYVPVRLTSSQRVDSLGASHPAQVQVDPWGNQVLRFDLALLPPHASRVITIDAYLALSDVPQPLPAGEAALRPFTRQERYVESEHPAIKAIAQGLKSGSALETAERTYHWVRHSLSRGAFTPDDRGALRVLQDRAGDCTEHAYLLAALLRANGIPARVMGGYLMPESGLLRASGYHNWAEFYYDGAWLLADAHQGNFARNATLYVATRVMSSSTSAPLPAGHRYVATAGLRVIMD
jgi:transglutaminase-like putative cysteine protease